MDGRDFAESVLGTREQCVSFLSLSPGYLTHRGLSSPAGKKPSRELLFGNTLPTLLLISLSHSSREHDNFKQFGDEGEVWFGHDAADDMLRWTLNNAPFDPSRNFPAILDGEDCSRNSLPPHICSYFPMLTFLSIFFVGKKNTSRLW
jgi:hypothetical protein